MSSNWFSDGKNQWFARTLWDAAKDLPVEVAETASLLTDEEMQRYVMTAHEYPIILGPDGTVLDGHHRLLKAWALGHKAINVKRLKEMPPPDGGPGAVKMRASHDQLAKEVEGWENGSRNLEGFVDAPEAATPQAPVCLGLVDVDVREHPGWPVRLPTMVYDYLMMAESASATIQMDQLWDNMSNYERETVERLLKRKR